MAKIEKTKIAVTIISVVIFVMAAVYLYGAIKMGDNFASDTYVNGLNIGGMSMEEANKTLGEANKWGGLEITVSDEEFCYINPEDIGSFYDFTEELFEVKKEYSQWLWFVYLFSEKSYEINVENEYDRASLEEFLDNLDVLYENAINAKVEFSEEEGQFVIAEDRYAFVVDRNELYGMIGDSIQNSSKTLVLDDYIMKPEATTESEELIQLREEANRYLGVTLTYDFGDRTEIVNKERIINWISIEEGEVRFDFDKVKEYERELAKIYNTYGDTRQFKTSYGETIKVGGGTYGWVMHITNSAKALIEEIKAGEDKTIEPVYSYSVLVRDTNDIGNSYVEINLTTQMVFVYVDGQLRVESPCVTGNVTKGWGTPTGIFPISYKKRDATLTGEDYSTPVRYWMPFNSNIGLHDAPWRSQFGGEIYKTSGSHGCINLPPEMAEKIYSLVYKKMPVVVYK